MAKKRKLEAKAEIAGPSELDSVNEESLKEEPANTSFSEVPIEGSSVLESGTFTKDDFPAEEEFNAEALETLDLVPEPSDPVDRPTENVAAFVDDGEDDDNDPSFLHKLLEPFAKEQLISLLRDAALKYPDLRASIRQIADADPTHRKVFIHGLGWNTTAETLTNIFSQFGEIEECNAVVDKNTGKSKGYGFILFKHRSGAWRALKEPQKKIGSRMAACQLASIGPVPAPPPVLPVSEYTQRKIYVSNVGSDIDPQKILQFFSKFGEIEEGPLGLDKVTGKPKGFCLFVYKSAESAMKALEEPHKNFDGHALHCQKAIDGPKPSKQGGYFHQGFSAFGPRGPQLGRSDGSALMGGMPSSICGPGHLIAPAASIGLNQAGMMVNNGGFTKPGVMGGYGGSQMPGNYGGAARPHGFGHISGGSGSYTGR